MSDKQATLPLMSASRIRPKRENIHLGDLPPDSQLLSDPPDKGLLYSLEVIGQLQDIVLFDRDWTKDGEGQWTGPEIERYHVEAGRRRIKALRVLDEDIVRATIFPCDVARESIITFMENHHRKHNPLMDYEGAIALINRYGATARDIAAATGVSRAAVDKALELANLNPILMNALRAAKLKVTLAIAIARLTKEQQARLVALYEQNGKLTAADVKAVKSAGAADAALTLPDEAFNVDDSTVDLPEDWRERIEQAVTFLVTTNPKKVNRKNMGEVAALLSYILDFRDRLGGTSPTNGYAEAGTDYDYGESSSDRIPVDSEGLSS
jgi:ParB-like chromosome segregation protein Spo0J